MKRRRIGSSCVVFGVGCLCVVVPAPGYAEAVTGQGPRWKLAEPDAAQQSEAEALVRDLFKSEFAGTEPGEMRALAGNLLRLGTNTNDDPVGRYVLFRQSRDLAAQAGDAALTLRAVDAMAMWYAIEAVEMKVAALDTAARATRTPQAQKLLAEGALATIDEAIDANNYEAADELLALARSAANDAESGLLIEQCESRQQEVYDFREQFQLVKAAAITLIENPDDPKSNLIVGKFLCFVKGNWDRGLPMLAKGGEPALRALAERDLAAPSGPGLQVAIGDGWWELSQKERGTVRRHLVARAERWYELALPKLGGLTRARIARRMTKKALLAFDGDHPPPAEWIEQQFNFWANYGRQGPAHWANFTANGETAFLAANRGGYVGTTHAYPDEVNDRYQIDTVIASDMLPGTALEFGGQRMHFSRDGIHLANGWRPSVAHTLESNKPHQYRIDVAPARITFHVDGEFVGTYQTESVLRAPIILRGWEGHLRCYRLVVWAMNRPQSPG